MLLAVSCGYQPLRNAVKYNDIITFQNEFPDFYANDATPIHLCNVKNRLIEILQDCAALQHAEIFDFVLTFCSDLEKEADVLIGAAGDTSSIDHLLSETTPVKHAQYALRVAIQGGHLNHIESLLEPAQGMVGPLQRLWLAIYHKNIDIFNYLLTTHWLPKAEVKFWETGWNDMLIDAANYNFPECATTFALWCRSKSKKQFGLTVCWGASGPYCFSIVVPTVKFAWSY